ncbi:type III secretion system export apparatus subunit SctS [Dyella sp.]|uniref:type III secretion system export apparatus subunit SctS n=1 Tax=Dyella sp. TaxID=1869338 RepID=UPI002ED21951
MYDQEIQLAREALWLVLVLSAPPIIAAALAGLLVAFLQAATQIQEQTFPYAVKFIVVVIALLGTAAMLGGTLYKFADRLFSGFAGMLH